MLVLLMLQLVHWLQQLKVLRTKLTNLKQLHLRRRHSLLKRLRLQSMWLQRPRTCRVWQIQLKPALKIL